MPDPVVASYCTTFLKPEMLHIYRQVTNLRRWRTFVVTHRHVNADQFPFDPIETLKAPRLNPLVRAWRKYVLKTPPLIYRGEYDVLAGVLEKRAASLLHVYFGHTGVHLLPFIHAWPKPVVVSFHGMDAQLRENDPAYGVKLRGVFDRSRLILARSQALAQRLESLGCPRAKLRLNPTGIPLDSFPFRVRTRPADGAWRVVQACRLIEKKGLQTSLRAFAQFAQIFPLARFVIAGEGSLQNTLEKHAAELGIADRVEFAGFVNQDALVDLYNQSHIFLHPSQTTENHDQEGIPNSMLEAMATGLPVVSTFHSGIPEAVVDGENGFLVPERDHEAVASLLTRLANEPALWETAGENASRIVRERFEISRQIAILEDCYTEAASAP
jgi:colanic acid/amylovoran biosynthesis glycosyltransferase